MAVPQGMSLFTTDGDKRGFDGHRLNPCLLHSSPFYRNPLKSVKNGCVCIPTGGIPVFGHGWPIRRRSGSTNSSRADIRTDIGSTSVSDLLHHFAPHLFVHCIMCFCTSPQFITQTLIYKYCTFVWKRDGITEGQTDRSTLVDLKSGRGQCCRKVSDRSGISIRTDKKLIFLLHILSFRLTRFSKSVQMTGISKKISTISAGA